MKEKEIMMNDKMKEIKIEETFLYNEAKLRHLLLGVPDENDVFDIISTISRLLFFGTIIKWINFNVWWLIGDCSYKKNVFISNLHFINRVNCPVKLDTKLDIQ